ncbi:hypothetical protein [Streptomyces stelliscabiei]|uniref:Uncharacterized protein n=1 Tax=Streptomyces stelliscabiei TaxID=146820 RepID=A0A8I0TRP5_9ACTN|nr:hypothetical protein [Streptomyces stelliscabiei]KND45316.1 hypothetical protein IQ64_07760 [Streptomyces stelliscabiei]MBE1597126.1 hypothetical protein [Streptomyces stelliscabiei]
MALVPVEIVNNSGQTVQMTLDENGEQLAHFRRMVRREELVSVEVIEPATTPRKSAARGKTGA